MFRQVRDWSKSALMRPLPAVTTPRMEHTTDTITCDKCGAKFDARSEYETHYQDVHKTSAPKSRE